MQFVSIKGDSPKVNLQVIELGNALQDKSLQRQNDQQITVADLTGVAVQDIMIAKAVYYRHVS